MIVFPTTGEHTRRHMLGHPGLDECDCVRLKEVMLHAP